jgi:hypothetical protein
MSISINCASSPRCPLPFTDLVLATRDDHADQQ